MNKYFQQDLLTDALNLVHQGKSYGEIKKFVRQNTKDEKIIKKTLREVNNAILSKTQTKSKDYTGLYITLGLLLILLAPATYTYFFHGKKLIFIPILIIYGYYKLNRMFRGKPGKLPNRRGKFRRKY